jgi:hypothetical protein
MRVATNQAFPNGSVNAARRSPSEGRSSGSSIEDAPAPNARRYAGHDLSYLWHDSDAEELRARGMPLGLMPGMSYE